MRRLGLRWRIVLFTAPVLAGLAFASLWMVNRNTEHQVHRALREDLRRSSAVFENILDARSTELRVAGAVIVHDPKFFSVLSLPVGTNDPMVLATVAGVASDFNRITDTDLFEVTDAHGRVLASVGRTESPAEAARPLIEGALSGHAVDGVVAGQDAHFQTVVTPVVADGRVVGTLLLGAEVGGALAARLRDLTRSEVTFVSAGRATGTTLARREDLDAASRAAVAHEQLVGSGGAVPGEVIVEQAAGQTWLTLVGPIPHSSAGERQLYVMQRSLSAETAFLREIRRRLVELGLVGGVVAVLAGLAIAGGITSPVQRLVRAAAEMERGNYDFPLDVRGGDEIGYLAARFEDMRRQQRATVSRLRESARAKSEFLAVASHELRTPISVVRGFQELLRAGSLGAVTDRQREALEAIGRSCTTLTRIAEDATRMAQIDGSQLELTPRPTDLADVIGGAIREARDAAPERRVTLSAHVEPDVGHVRADGARLLQAISQLVRNGIRFTPDGGQVEVRAKRTPNAVEIAVHDTGVGLSEEQRERLLARDPVLRDSLNHHSSTALEFNSAGLGLGLGIARGIIEAHGGTLRVESEQGRGSVFVLCLPEEVAPIVRAA